MVKNVRMNELEQALKAGTASVIDCRETYEFEEGHIPGAINTPTSEFYELCALD
jgi:rhodanese-related sulfurtransferase